MEKATVSKLKNQLSAYLRKVRAGHTVVIYDRDMPIARLERIETSGSGTDRLALLQAKGLIHPPRRPQTAATMRATLAAPAPSSAALLEALVADRTDGR